MQNRGKLVLLFELTVHLNGEDDRVWRGEKGVLSDGLEDVANRDLRREGVAVRNGWFAVVAVPNVDCMPTRVSAGSLEPGKWN